MNRQIISTLFGLLAISLAGQASAYTAVDYHPYACHLIGSNGQGIQPYYNVNIGTISNISGASVIAVCPLHEVSTNTQHIYYVDGNGISGCNVCWKTSYNSNTCNGMAYNGPNEFTLSLPSMQTAVEIQCWLATGTSNYLGEYREVYY